MFIFSNVSYQPYKFSEPVFVLKKTSAFCDKHDYMFMVYLLVSVSENEAEVNAWQSDIVIVYRRYRGKS